MRASIYDGLFISFFRSNGIKTEQKEQKGLMKVRLRSDQTCSWPSGGRMDKIGLAGPTYLFIELITGTETAFTPGGEPPLVPVPHPGASIRD